MAGPDRVPKVFDDMAYVDERPLSRLSREQLAQFLRDGFTVLRDAFPREIGDALLPLALAEQGIDLQDRSTWTDARFLIKKSFTQDVFAGLYTPRVCEAIDDLVGPGGWPERHGTGYVLGALPGFDDPPWGPRGGGHVDGIHFHHHLDGREQGLVGVFMYTDVDPHGAGTWISVGSHRTTARALHAAEPDGLSPSQINRVAGEAAAGLPIVEATGRAGDLLLMHPQTYHGSSKHLGDRIRLASNMCIALHDKKNLQRDEALQYSPVEYAIVDALNGGA